MIRYPRFQFHSPNYGFLVTKRRFKFENPEGYVGREKPKKNDNNNKDGDISPKVINVKHHLITSDDDKLISYSNIIGVMDVFQYNR